MPERHPNPLFGYVFGAALGTLIWNLIFLGLSAAGLLTGPTVWLCIKVTYAAVFFFAGICWASSARAK